MDLFELMTDARAAVAAYQSGDWRLIVGLLAKYAKVLADQTGVRAAATGDVPAGFNESMADLEAAAGSAPVAAGAVGWTPGAALVFLQALVEIIKLIRGL